MLPTADSLTGPGGFAPGSRCIWRIELFGGVRAHRLDISGAPELNRFRTQKAAELLAFLAVRLGQSVPRETLLEALWPEGELEATRHRLNVALSWLRTQLEPPGIQPGSVLGGDRHVVFLESETVTTDLQEMVRVLGHPGSAASERARSLESTLRRCQGELLAGQFSDWVLEEQRTFTTQLRLAAGWLVRWLEEQGERERALAAAHRMVALDPLAEAGHATLIRLYVELGQPDLAQRQYRELERRLRSELGTAPSAATQAILTETTRGGQPPPTVTQTSPADVPRSTEPVGGAVPLHSPYYVERDTDHRFREAVGRGDSIVLVKGTSQVGKTSLLIRGLEQARQTGGRTVFTSLQALSAEETASPSPLLRSLCDQLAEALGLPPLDESSWPIASAANLNASRYLRRVVLRADQPPLIWGLDEIDRLFDFPYAAEILGLFRSWHNERALNPEGPWSRLTLAMTYATEAHLHLTDLNQSPFNVGTRLGLADFDLEQTRELCARHGLPGNPATVAVRLHALVGGHPYLLRRALLELVRGGTNLEEIEAKALEAGGPFSDHLHRLWRHLEPDTVLTQAVIEALGGKSPSDERAFLRLRTAGVLEGTWDYQVQFRCPLYRGFLSRCLAQ